MTTRDQLVFGLIAAAFLALLPVGWAVAKTWNPTLTAFALAGVLLIGAIWANGHAAAHGVALHDRRTGAMPSIRMEAPPSTGVAYLDAVRDAQIRELDSRTIERHGRAELARFGMEPREIPIRDWRVTAQEQGWPEEGFGE